MSASVHCEIACDSDGCDKRFVSYSSRTTPIEARKHARQAGWACAVRGMLFGGTTADYCPAHLPTPTREKRMNDVHA